MYWNPFVEQMPKNDLKELQERKLRALVRYAYEYSPFYRWKFKEHGIDPWDIKGIEDLPKLPFTKKQDLRDNYPFGMFAVSLLSLIHI